MFQIAFEFFASPEFLEQQLQVFFEESEKIDPRFENVFKILSECLGK
jgi:hypothetical protein